MTASCPCGQAALLCLQGSHHVQTHSQSSSDTALMHHSCLQAVRIQYFDILEGGRAEDALLECVKRDHGLPGSAAFQHHSWHAAERCALVIAQGRSSSCALLECVKCDHGLPRSAAFQHHSWHAAERCALCSGVVDVCCWG